MEERIEATSGQVRLPTRPLGTTGLRVTEICIGCGAVPDVIRAVFAGPYNFVDTAAIYGDGINECRIGKVLDEIGGLPAGFVLQTKADRDALSGRFTGDQARRSVERSLRLLGLDRLQICLLHDPEHSPDDILEPGGAVEALVKLREEGVIGHLGLGMGPIDQILRYLECGAFEIVLSHNRYNLLNLDAEPLLRYAANQGIAVLNAAPYGSGILAKGPDEFPRFMYRSASPELIERARRLEALCARHGVPLAAVALQFSLREPRICATVVGINRPERLAQTLELSRVAIPPELWAELDALLPPRLEA